MALMEAPIPNVTLVAFRKGDKPQALTELWQDVQEWTDSAFASAGCAGGVDWHEAGTVHSTVLGGEIVRLGGKAFNLNWLNNKTTLMEPDLAGFCKHIKQTCHPDGQLFEIRHAGFAEAQCSCSGVAQQGWMCESGAEFHSCDRTPYEASCYAVAGGPLMITGWPVGANGEFDHSLHGIRVAGQGFGLLDKYHTDEDGKTHWADDDWYSRLGTVREVPQRVLARIVDEVRLRLSRRPQVTYPVRLEDLSVVVYKDTRLKELLSVHSIDNVIANPGLLPTLYGGIGHRIDKYQNWRRKFAKLASTKDGANLDNALPGRLKYDPASHDAKKFDGISVIHSIDARKAGELGLTETFGRVRKAFEEAELSARIAFVDTKTVHATTFDLINRPDYQKQLHVVRGASDDRYQTVRDAVQTAAIGWLEEKGLNLRATARITGVGMFAPDVLKLDLAFDSGEMQEFQAYRLALHKHLCLEVPAYEKFRSAKWTGRLAAHITIGYFVEPLTEAEIDRLLVTVKQLNKRFEEIEFELSEGEVASFEDMDHYQPVRGVPTRPKLLNPL